MTQPSEIVLASASPRRRALLGTLIGHPPRVLTADIDESVRAGEAPEAYARRLAEAKALAVAERLTSEAPSDEEAGAVDEAGAMQPETRAAAASARAATRTCLILGSDTIVVFEGAILGKPADAEAARDCLRRLRGRCHEVITAVALVEVTLAEAPGTASDARAARSSGLTQSQRPTRIQVEAATTGVWMRDYSEAEMAAYVDTGDPMDKAGAYAIQHRGFSPVARLAGSESNVIGLPLGLTARMLRRFGMQV
jgi:septum formation protein